MANTKYKIEWAILMLGIATIIILLSKMDPVPWENIRNILCQKRKLENENKEVLPPYTPTSKVAALQKKQTLELVHIDYVPITKWTGPDTIKTLTSQLQIKCKKRKLLGRKSDGGWSVCFAKPFFPKKPCTIYSFGINFDFSFDDTYQCRFGCTVRSFDPSMNTSQHEHSPSVWFYPIGLSDNMTTLKNGWKMNTFKGLLKKFNDEHKTIPYLKFDIENFEWRVLTNMLDDGALQNVMQMSFEIHMTKKQYHDKTYFDILKRFEDAGFKRWHSRPRGGRFRYQRDMSFLNIKFIEKLT